MTMIEKKFKVASLEPYMKALENLGVKPFKDAVSVHHYAQDSGSTIRKIVEEEHDVRITELEDRGGIFEFTKRESVDSLEDALAWMREHGHYDLKKVKMAAKEYEYKDGKIELITINDGALYSVVLYYESPMHEEIAKDIGLKVGEKIEVPFSHLV